MAIEKLAGSKVKFEIEVPVEKFKEAYEKAFQKENEKVEIKGFRKGHAPRAMVEPQVKAQVVNDALNECMSEAYYDYVVKNNIEVCAQPKIDFDEAKFSEDKPIVFTATVAVNPEVELGEYTNLGIKVEKTKVSAKEVNDEVKRSLERDSMLVKKEGEDAVIAKGDTAVFDFEGLKDGVPFEGGTSKDYSLEIGSGQFIPGFEDQMIGMKAGEKKDLNVTFPEDYHAEDLKGAQVVFKVEVKEIKVREVPELNDEWVKEQKIEGVETVEQYKEHTKKTIFDRKDKANKDKAKNDLYMTVVKNAKFELPEELVEDEANYSLEAAQNQAKQYGLELETLLMYSGQGSLEEYKKSLHEQAKNTLSLRFVLREIARKENFEATKEEIKNKYTELADQYKLSVDQVKAQVSLSAINEEIVSQRAYDFIAEKNPFVEE